MNKVSSQLGFRHFIDDMTHLSSRWQSQSASVIVSSNIATTISPCHLRVFFSYFVPCLLSLHVKRQTLLLPMEVVFSANRSGKECVEGRREK